MIVGLALQTVRVQELIQLLAQKGARQALIRQFVRANPNEMQVIRHQHVDRAGQPKPCKRVYVRLAEPRVPGVIQPTRSPVFDGLGPEDVDPAPIAFRLEPGKLAFEAHSGGGIGLGWDFGGVIGVTTDAT